MTSSSNDPRDDGANAVIEAVEIERTRLRRALSVMASAQFALNYSDWIEDESGLDFADVVAVACDLVKKVMTNLDSVKLQPSGTKARPRRSRSVRPRPRTAKRVVTAPEAPADTTAPAR